MYVQLALVCNRKTHTKNHTNQINGENEAVRYLEYSPIMRVTCQNNYVSSTPFPAKLASMELRGQTRVRGVRAGPDVPPEEGLKSERGWWEVKQGERLREIS